MKDFLKGKLFKVIACVVALLIGIMIYQAASGGFASFPEAVVGTFVTPIVKVSASISDSVAGFFNSLVNAKDIEKENKELRSELAEAYKDLSDYEKAKKENEQLKKVLGIKEQNPDYEMEAATVIGRDSASAFGKFTVNKGSLNNIKTGSPVITEDGLVGIITEVGPTYSVVTTILDPDINVGIFNSRTQETGVVGGSAELYNKGRTKLKMLPRDTALLSGDIIETSGIGGVFPSGILIGTVKSMGAENSGVSMYAEIEPIVDVTRVSDVVIVTEFSEYQPPETENTEDTSSDGGEENKEKE
ncbi:MAG: rod shape-determining protein MreC [Oscillospiraceae bacterium]|nr:rod shape-determining protein MreC [Oscillospiraceae bacterium]